MADDRKFMNPYYYPDASYLDIVESNDHRKLLVPGKPFVRGIRSARKIWTWHDFVAGVSHEVPDDCDAALSGDRNMFKFRHKETAKLYDLPAHTAEIEDLRNNPVYQAVWYERYFTKNVSRARCGELFQSGFPPADSPTDSGWLAWTSTADLTNNFSLFWANTVVPRHNPITTPNSVTVYLFIWLQGFITTLQGSGAIIMQPVIQFSPFQGNVWSLVNSFQGSSPVQIIRSGGVLTPGMFLRSFIFYANGAWFVVAQNSLGQNMGEVAVWANNGAYVTMPLGGVAKECYGVTQCSDILLPAPGWVVGNIHIQYGTTSNIAHSGKYNVLNWQIQKDSGCNNQVLLRYPNLNPGGDIILR